MDIQTPQTAVLKHPIFNKGSTVLSVTNEVGIVCPAQLRHGLFTFGVLNHLDHNLPSTTTKGCSSL